MKKNFLLLNEAYILENSVEIFNGYRIKSPDMNQLKGIEFFFKHFSPYFINYDRFLQKEKTNNRELPMEKWRFAILEYDSVQADFTFRKALRLIDKDVSALADIYITLPGQDNAMSIANFDILESFLYLHSEENKILELKWETADSLYLKIIYDSIKENEIKADIKKETNIALEALQSLIQLNMLQKYNTLRSLGLYSIIEYLIVNDPYPKRKSDSITKQFVKKYKVLNNRFVRKLNINAHFQSSSDEDTMLKNLYKFRSQIAHGSFKSITGAIQDLVSVEKVILFLELYVKRLIIQTLNEPDFIKRIKLE